MRTLSARILLGFAALTVMFGVITATLVVNMRRVEIQAQRIGLGLWPLTLYAKELNTRQKDLNLYLDKGDADKDSKEPGRVVASSVRRYRAARDYALGAVLAVLEGKNQDVQLDLAQIRDMTRGLDTIKKQVQEESLPLYDKLLEPPEPSDAEHGYDLADLFVQYLLNNETLDTWLALAADPNEPARVEVLGKLRKLEALVTSNTTNLALQLERSSKESTTRLVENEHKLYVWNIYLGVAAVGIGLLVTIWVVYTLRPLRRLRDGAQRVAAGDYGNSIPEKGPSDVAELAREFNSMGRAIQEREREKVRAERLAAVGKTSALITHEIRNPLSSIALNVDLLEDYIDEGDREARDLYKEIHREIDRVAQLTEGYLRLEPPKPKLAAEAVNPMVGALAAFVKEDLAAKNIQLKVDLAPGDPIATIDANQIRQCLINLVRNAADAVMARTLRSEGIVTLRTRVHAGAPPRIDIEVEDNGIGIDPEAQARLFEPFFTTKEKGSGLGLALTHQIIRDHGGDITVASTVGRGTTFTVTVPTGG